jgi:flagellar basal-body rod protein FlgC
VHVSNMVNANTTQPPGVEPFRRKDVVFRASPAQASFGAEFETAVQGVEISNIVTDQSEPIKRYEPGHKHADENGIVTYPNVEIETEMGNALSAARSYEANLQAVTAAKEMAQRTLEILK